MQNGVVALENSLTGPKQGKHSYHLTQQNYSHIYDQDK